MIKLKYRNEGSIKELSEFILKGFEESKKDEIVFCGIGTDKCIGDCLGPMVGTMLLDAGVNMKVYGTVDTPIHALNIDKRAREVYNDHPNAFIIGVDACLGEKDSIGEIHVRDSAIRAGKGVGKALPEVGDYSIVGIVDSSDCSEFFSQRSIRLAFVMATAKVIVNIIKEVDNQYKKSKERSNKR